MSDLHAAYQLSRTRLEQEIAGLSADQLRWRPHATALSIGEMALHVAGVEISFVHQLTGAELDESAERLRLCATEGVVNENPFPLGEAEIDPQCVSGSLELARTMAEPILENPTAEIRAREIKSALGPMIDGLGAVSRMAFHPAYHQGQAYSYKTDPNFPQG
jgi:hypothetical protein